MCVHAQRLRQRRMHRCAARDVLDLVAATRPRRDHGRGSSRCCKMDTPAYAPMTPDYRDRITIEPGKRSGKPCIRGLRITVYDVLGYLGSGMSVDEVLEDFPSLEREDVLAVLQYAADRERTTALAS